MNTINIKNEDSAEKLPTIDSFLSKAESTIKVHLNGIDFMDEEEIRSYLIQLQLLTELEPRDSKRKYDVKYKLNKILDEYSQIIMDISQETNNSSFDVNLLTNANFLSNSSSSDSGITADIIPETQKFESISPYKTRGRKKKIGFSEYTKQAILTKRRKIMTNNEIINSETDLLEDSQNCNTIEENSQELELTIPTTNSIDQSMDQVEEIENSVSDTETVLFDIENMEICTNNENAAISTNSEEMAEYSNTNHGNRIASPKEKYVEKRNTTSEYTEDIIKETQISQYNKSFRKNDVSATGCQDPGIIKSNKPTNEIGNFESRYNKSLTNISSTQITSCNTISTQNFASTIPPTNSSSIGQTMPHTSQNTNTILYTALPNNKYVKTHNSNIYFDSRNLNKGLEKSKYTSQFGYFENVKHIDNKNKVRCLQYFDIPQANSKTNERFLEATTHTQNKLALLENVLPEDVYFAKSSTSHNLTDKSFIGNAKHIDAIQSKESIFPEYYSNNSSRSVSKNNKDELFNKTIENAPNSRNEYEMSSSEANVESYNEEQEIAHTISSIDPNKNVLKNLIETNDFSASFQTNLMKDLKIYSEMNEYKMQTSITKIETKSNNPFLCRGRKELLCEAVDPKINERRRNKLIAQDVETMTDMFADMFRNYIRLADLNKSDLHMQIKNDSNIL